LVTSEVARELPLHRAIPARYRPGARAARLWRWRADQGRSLRRRQPSIGRRLHRQLLASRAGLLLRPAGQLCHRIARCGDGVAVLPELCDDGNNVAGDGCSPTCKVEIGFKCSGSPSVCTHTTCGDGKSRAQRVATTATPCPLMAARRIARSSPIAVAPRARPGAAMASCSTRRATMATTSTATAAPRTARSNRASPAPNPPSGQDDGSCHLPRLPLQHASQAH